MTGKTLRPIREPLFSKGHRESYPIPPEYEKVNYMGFIGSHIKNRSHILISQSLCQNYFSGIFATHKKLSGRQMSWWTSNDYDALFKYIKQRWERGLYVHSLVADDTTGMFGVFLIEGYGKNQWIIPFNPINEPWFDNDITHLLRTCRDGKNDQHGKTITSCTSKDSTYYIVMADNVIGYESEHQVFFTSRRWSGVEEGIRSYYNDGCGHKITSLCYNQGLEEYLVVMTLSRDEQKWFKSGHAYERSVWISEMSELGYLPSLIFNDQTDGKTFVVMTSDNDRSLDHVVHANIQLISE